ncbi:MAG: FAD-binding oxidoreductase, partial [Pseudomonadota bacterium]
MNPNDAHAEIVVVGAGIAGLACAYYLTRDSEQARRVVLLDPRPPMSLTSAQSGENYRDWWPHPVMAEFARRSIERMSDLTAQASHPIRMTRSGYVLATRRDADDLAGEWTSGRAPEDLRLHTSPGSYPQDTFSGLDVLAGPAIEDLGIEGLDPAVQTLIHVRCGGQIDSQQLGQHMLEAFRAAGGVRKGAQVVQVAGEAPFRLGLSDGTRLQADALVLAPGPFINELVSQFQAPLPISHVLQQKLAFPDVHGVISRNCPFLIDLDRQVLNFSAEERAALREEPELAWLCEEFPGGIHCRPDGSGNWIKMGWAFNTSASVPEPEPALSDHFSEVVLRGASRLQPGLGVYTERLPREAVHYGGYYSMTEENWPL